MWATKTMTDHKQLNAERLAKVHPIFAARVESLLDHLEAQGEALLLTEGFRDPERQAQLWAQGRTLPGPIVTNAPAGCSQHEYGLAVDLCPFKTPTLSPTAGDKGGAPEVLDWNEDHPVWKRLLAEGDKPEYRLSEGAHWQHPHDAPHFYPVEIPATTEKLRELCKLGGLPAVWKWFESLVPQVSGEDAANLGHPDSGGPHLAKSGSPTSPVLARWGEEPHVGTEAAP
jgi:peptidoglycan L-alanyl-D-glutamate endopeptidase CwlK